MNVFHDSVKLKIPAENSCEVLTAPACERAASRRRQGKSWATSATQCVLRRRQRGARLAAPLSQTKLKAAPAVTWSRE